MRDDDGWLVLFGVLAGIAIGLAVGASLNSSVWEKQALQHKAAYYDQTTGEFKWNEASQEVSR